MVFEDEYPRFGGLCDQELYRRLYNRLREHCRHSQTSETEGQISPGRVRDLVGQL